MDQAACLCNHLTNKHSILALLEIFTGSKIDPSTLRNEKVRRFPGHALDPKIQDGKKLHKWDPHTRQGKCIEKSIAHASSFGLITNLRTGYMHPQFHMVYDIFFQTVMGGMKKNMILLSTCGVLWFKGRKIMQKM